MALHSARKTFLAVLRCQNGVALIEFAVCISLLLILFIGAIEVSRYVLIVQKLQYAVDKETNLITSINTNTLTASAPMTTSEMAAMTNDTTLGYMMAPYPFNTNGYAMITDIYDDPLNTTGSSGGTPTVEWRFCSATNASIPGLTASGGTYSRFGSQGGNAILTGIPAVPPATSFTLNPGDEIIVAEIYYNFQPLFSDVITRNIFGTTKPFYTIATSVPRESPLYGLVQSSNSKYSNQAFTLNGTLSTAASNCQ